MYEWDSFSGCFFIFFCLHVCVSFSGKEVMMMMISILNSLVNLPRFPGVLPLSVCLCLCGWRRSFGIVHGVFKPLAIASSSCYLPLVSQRSLGRFFRTSMTSVSSDNDVAMMLLVVC